MILIIDFGSQFNQLIARRVREGKVYCQVEPPSIPIDAIKTLAPKGIILSGGPASIYAKNSPRVDAAIFDLGIPILGICYGMHFMVDTLTGEGMMLSLIGVGTIRFDQAPSSHQIKQLVTSLSSYLKQLRHKVT